MVECFFFIENPEQEDLATLRALCMNCRKNYYPPDFPSWFYSGPVGPWDVKCNHCKDLIYKHEEIKTAS